MSLVAGTRLGPYEILSPIGAGGMGEVYKAKDSRLDRTVAIKVLPEHVADSPELKERFEREAKAVSSLNHPNICTLYDVGHEDGVDYLVMEHLEGDNLAETLSKARLPLDQALKVGSQIADALDKAHREGVVHRDLKPANVVLTKQGAKLLDFGLAKQLDDPAVPGGSELSARPTEAQPLTREGTLLGTFQYMAPEQLEGHAVTPQSDIFALGAVLFEMVTGQRAFKGGGSTASVISVIMTAEPPAPSSLQPGAPPALDALIQGCLAKDPEERWQSAGDIARQIKWIAAGPDSSSQLSAAVSPPTASPKSQNRVSMLAAGLVLGGVVSAIAAWWLVGSPSPAPVPTRLLVTAPVSEPLRGNLALSPDGRTLVYVGFRDNEQLVYRRRIGEWEAMPLRGTADASSQSISPDGEWVAFITGSALKKASLSGGTAVTLCEACAGSAGLSWGPNGIAVSQSEGLFLVPGAGGMPIPLLAREEDGPAAVEARWLPGGEGLLFTADGTMYVVNPESGGPRSLGDGRGPKYTASGHLVYSRAGTLWAVGFDADRLETTGEPVPVLENVLVNPNGFPRFALSESGTLAYISSEQRTGRRMVSVDSAGRPDELVADPDAYLFPRLSPDGRSIVVDVRAESQAQDIWVFDLERGTKTRIVREGSNEFPAWMPDGSRVSFVSRAPGRPNGVYTMNGDGTGEAELLVESETRLTTLNWHPGGTILAIEWTQGGVFDIALLGEDKSVSFMEETPFNETAPAFSPDGRYLAYVSDESGTPEVYVRAFPGPGKWTISRGGGREPVWSRDGKSLFYRKVGEMWAVAIEPGTDFRAGAATLLFNHPFAVRSGSTQTTPNYDVSENSGFVMLQSVGDHDVLTEVRVIVNWDEELKELVPTGN